MNRVVEKDRGCGYRLFLSISTGKETPEEILKKRVVGVLACPSLMTSARVGDNECFLIATDEIAAATVKAKIAAQQTRAPGGKLRVGAVHEILRQEE